MGLKRLKSQLKSKKVIVKLYLRRPLHAKLYLMPQSHHNLKAIAFLGSSNLTFSGLSTQGELNVNILDNDATNKLDIPIGTQDAEFLNSTGGQLGSPKSARYRTYYKLDAYIKRTETPLFPSGEDWQNLKQAVEEIYLYPLKETTVIKINRQLKSGITDEQLATMIVSLRDNNSLCIIHPEDVPQEARIICSLGLFSGC